MILRIILRSLVINSIAILRMILKLGIAIELRPSILRVKFRARYL